MEALLRALDGKRTAHFGIHGRPLLPSISFRFWFTGIDCCHAFGLFARREVAGPDGICVIPEVHYQMPQVLIAFEFRINALVRPVLKRIFE
jgi:hypothetical protein